MTSDEAEIRATQNEIRARFAVGYSPFDKVVVPLTNEEIEKFKILQEFVEGVDSPGALLNLLVEHDDVRDWAIEVVANSSPDTMGSVNSVDFWLRSVGKKFGYLRWDGTWIVETAELPSRSLAKVFDFRSVARGETIFYVPEAWTFFHRVTQLFIDALFREQHSASFALSESTRFLLRRARGD